MKIDLEEILLKLFISLNKAKCCRPLPKGYSIFRSSLYEALEESSENNIEYSEFINRNLIKSKVGWDSLLCFPEEFDREIDIVIGDIGQNLLAIGELIELLIGEISNDIGRHNALEHNLKLFEYASDFYILGLNITCVKESYTTENMKGTTLLKHPYHPYTHLHSERLKLNGFLSYDWTSRSLVGIGAALGRNNWMVVDLDNFNDILLHCFLQGLGLDLSYGWIVKTGSGKGFHLHLLSSKPDSLEHDTVGLEYSNTVHVRGLGSPKVTLLYQTHVVLPGSKHADGEYKFQAGFPRARPVEKSYGEIQSSIQSAIDNYEETRLKHYSGESIIAGSDTEDLVIFLNAERSKEKKKSLEGFKLVKRRKNLKNASELSDTSKYSEKLKTIEWYNKRHGIIARDNYTCQGCQVIAPINLKMPTGQGSVSIRSLNVAEEVCSELFETSDASAQVWIDCFATAPKSWFLQDDVRFLISNQENYLNVHHNYYVGYSMPWLYPDEALVTFCAECHKKWHDQNVTMVFQSWEQAKLGNGIPSEVCWKCHGVGELPQYHYHENGVCFACDGIGLTLNGKPLPN